MKLFLNSSESGFTLLEALIALMLSSVILLFLSSGIMQLNSINELVIANAQSISSSKSKIKGSRQIEWHLFLNQLEGYLENTQLIDYTSDSITVMEENLESNESINIKYGRSKTGYENFNRSKNNGYNAMLTDIKNFNIVVDEQWLILSILFKNDEEYKGRIWVESWKEEESLQKN